MSGEGMIPSDSAWQPEERRGIASPVTDQVALQALMDSHVRFRDELRQHLASGLLGERVDLMVNAALERVDQAIKRGCEEFGLEAMP